MKDIADFVYLVAEMRKAQKSYFKTRNKGALIRSKELEKKVDDLLEDLG